MSRPEPVFAATEALGCTSSKDSENTFISVPVAVLNAATMALNASSSAGTKRFQRITVSLAPGSAFHGDAWAQALANSSKAGPVSAPAAASAVPPLITDRRVKSCIVISPLRFFGCSGVEPLTRRLVEQMNERGIWFKPDLVARIELMTFAEYRNDLLAAELGEHLRFRSCRFHHHDLGFRAVVRDGEMLGPDTIDRRPAVGIGRRAGERQFYAVRSLEAGAAIRFYFAVQEIHRRRADKTGDELVVGAVVKFE